ncbi:MAG: MBL fold metallo-hydrolase [Deltaproteobacteria bacterium]|nr:MBL fold metallo-hydrolase [Deltaproteobacteria bacterium]
MLLISRGAYTLFDLGSGALRQLSRIGISHERISKILITHFHPDHTADLIHFLFATRSPDVLKRRAPFLLLGPLGFSEFLEGLQRPYGKWLKVPADIMGLDELDISRPDGREYSDFAVLSQPLPHTPQSIAYRVEGPSGATFVYSGDTGYSNELIEFARDTDLLVTECSFPDGGPVEGHLTPSEAGRIAAQAHVKRLLLVHFYPGVLATDISMGCRRAFKGELILGQDFMHLEV